MVELVQPLHQRVHGQRLEALQEEETPRPLRHTWVPYDKISMNLKRALVAAEDANFMEHEGFDWDAIQRLRAQPQAGQDRGWRLDHHQQRPTKPCSCRGGARRCAS